MARVVASRWLCSACLFEPFDRATQRVAAVKVLPAQLAATLNLRIPLRESPHGRSFTPALIRRKKVFGICSRFSLSDLVCSGPDHCWMSCSPSTYNARPVPDCRALVTAHRMSAKPFGCRQPDVTSTVKGSPVRHWHSTVLSRPRAVSRWSNCPPSPTTAMSHMGLRRSQSRKMRARYVSFT